MRIRLTKIDEFQFLTCFKHQVWGSKSARFKDWKVSDYIVFTVEKALAGFAEISGEPYFSRQRVWDNGVFPHRVPIKFIHVFLPENRPPILGEVRDVLTSAWGPTYGWGIRNQAPLQDDPAETIIRAIQSRRNDLEKIQANLDQYLEEAKLQRDAAVAQKRKPGKPRKSEIEPEVEERQPSSEEEESAHSRAQSALIQLGKVTNCSVWIALNDQGREYKGKRLGEGCLKSLPRLGLSKEATDSISRIDIIWTRQNAPVCAFEVETTTSIYSGLLRMSDLLSLVPALNIKLFVIAPRERQGKVMKELARPTFQKIGLSEYCRFIPAEDLDLLLSKLEGLEGHIQPSVINPIAIGLEDELESALE